MTLVTFPIHPVTKKPTVAWGSLKESVPTPPGFYTGVVTGAISGVIVLDLDEKNGKSGTRFLAQSLGIQGGIVELCQSRLIPVTTVVRTRRGGYHAYFKHPGYPVKNAVGLISKESGIDIRGDGGMAVAPPTPGYDVLFEAPLAPVPAWLASHLQRRKPAAAEPTITLDREDARTLAKRMRASKNHAIERLGRALTAACNGEPFAQPGEVDQTLWDLCREIAKAYPSAKPESYAGFFAQSLTLMAQDDRGTDPNYVIEKAERARAEIAAADVAPEIRKDAERAKRLRAMGRGEVYTPEELSSFGDLTHKWIIRQGRNLFFYFNGAYKGPFGDIEAPIVAHDLLAPAPLSLETEEGQKNINQLLIEYGTHVEKTVFDLRATASKLEERTLILAPCPPKGFDPVPDRECDYWLRLFARDDYDNLELWLADLLNLSDPAVALVLTGKKGTGKTSLAFACSRFWTDAGPTSIQTALGRWNYKLIECPLVLADEQVPKDTRGYLRTPELREFIAARARPLERRFCDTADLVGCVRMIFTSNDHNLFSSNEQLTAHSVEAIGERLYQIKVNDAAEHYLKTVDAADLFNRRMPRHIAYLQKTVQKPERRPRFLIEDHDNVIHRQLATSSGVRAQLCQLFVAYLCDPALYDKRGSMLMRTRDGKLLVNVKGILEAWTIYIVQDRERQPPDTSLVSRAMLGLVTEEKVTARIGQHTKANYRVIDPAMLYQWAEDTEFASREEIDRGLAVDSEKRSGRALPC